MGAIGGCSLPAGQGLIGEELAKQAQDPHHLAQRFAGPFIHNMWPFWLSAPLHVVELRLMIGSGAGFLRRCLAAALAF